MRPSYTRAWGRSSIMECDAVEAFAHALAPVDCQDCKHRVIDSADIARCSIAHRRDGGVFMCLTERSSIARGDCGPYGRFFVSRR